jgi:haloalkane dehalogenase
MHYLDEGTGDPIVFVAGNPSWSFEARHLIKALSGQYRCIAVDHLGFGFSDKPANFSYTPQAHAQNQEALLTALRLERITFVVGDWGGPIGLSYAINHPDQTRFAVITNTFLWSVKSDWYYQGFSKFMGGPLGRWLTRNHNFFAQNVVYMAFGDKSKLTPAIHRHYLAQSTSPDERTGQWVFPGQIIGASDWLAGLWERRAALNGKVGLIAWGGKDIAFREKELQTWTAAFPAARVLRFPASGHYLLEENPVEVAQAIRDLLK